MFNSEITTVSRGLEAVRRSIRTTDTLRSMLAGSTLCAVSPLCVGAASIAESAPDIREWKIIDHCAAITRIYAEYEACVEALLSSWLLMLQRSRKYAEFDEDFKKHHRQGVANLLRDIDQRRYSHLDVRTTIEGYFRAISNHSAYRLMPESILAHDQNIRIDELATLFRRCCVQNLREWLERNPTVRNFFRGASRESDTVEAELKQLVERRNEAAHGRPSDVLGRDTLLEYADFVEVICRAMAELLTWHLVQGELIPEGGRRIAKCSEHFRTGAFVAIVEGATLRKGDTLYFRGPSYCLQTRVLSLRINDVDTPIVQVLAPAEVGILCDAVPPKHADICVVGMGDDADRAGLANSTEKETETASSAPTIAGRA